MPPPQIPLLSPLSPTPTSLVPNPVHPPRRAYAKLLLQSGPHVYLTSTSTTIGRGPGASYIISDDQSISRVHARIAYSTSSQAFELTVLGKNGASVNGDFITRNSQPVALASQTEVTFGRANPVTFVFLLPAAPVGKAGSVSKPQERRLRSLLYHVGKVIIDTERGRLDAVGILRAVRKKFPAYADAFGSDAVLASSIRHALTFNHHLFVVHEGVPGWNPHRADLDCLTMDDAQAVVPEAYTMAAKMAPAAEFGINPLHRASVGPPGIDTSSLAMCEWQEKFSAAYDFGPERTEMMAFSLAAMIFTQG